MNRTFKRTLSAILSLFLILTAFSAFAVTSFASEVKIESEDELISALESTEKQTITLSANIIVSESEYEEYRYHVKGKHSLDLNGFTITVTNESNIKGNPEDSTLFIIETGASLVISDSSDSKSGSIKYLGGIHLFSESTEYSPLEKITARNLFYISENTSLTVSGGTFVSGNYEKEWLHRSLSAENSKFEYYTGFAVNVVYGTVFDVASKATLVIDRGEFHAHGASRENTLPNRKGWDEAKPASACIRSESGSSVTVNDGKFIGEMGANVFDFSTSSTVHILAGSFNNTAVAKERISDYDGFAMVVPTEHYGHVNLPVGTIYEENRGRFIQNGEFLEELPGNTYIKNSNGNEIILSPAEGHPTWIKAVNFKTSYAPGAKGSLDSNYDPYFLSGSTITYKWYYTTANGTLKEIANSNSKTLNLAKLSLSIGSTYSFRCIITETYNGNNSYRITTVSHNYKLSTSNKYLIAGVSLTPSSIDSDNRYYPAAAPSFKVPSNANYTFASAQWYELGSDTPISSSSALKPNSSYYVVAKVNAKGSYTFTSDSRVSFLQGATSATLIPSSDGKSAVVTGYVTTGCGHSEYKYHINETNHTSYCTVCGTVNKSASHTYSEWVVSGTVFERRCSSCSHVEKMPITTVSDDTSTVINGAVIDFGVPVIGSAPAAPSLYTLPDSDKLVISEYSWKDSEGGDVTAFENEKSYTLTIKLTLADPTASLFDAASTVSSVFPSASTVTVSESFDELTAVFTVTPYAAKKATITLPTVKEGESVLNSKPNVTLDSYTVVWRKDGALLGSYKVNAGNVGDVTDLNDGDNVEFSEAVFLSGSAYSVYIEWDGHADKYYVSPDAVALVSNYSAYHHIYSATKGFATGGFIVTSDEKIIRAPGVSGITAPVLGKKPTTSTSSLKIVNSGYKVSSVSWNKNGSSVSSFTCGNAYTVKVTLTASEGYSFLATEGTINGAHASVSGSESSIVLTYTFPALTHSIAFDKASVTLPTCKDAGQVKESCSKCSLTAVINIPALDHKINDVERVEPTCENNGTEKHGICLYCITLFDQNNAEITSDSLVLPADKSSHSASPLTVHDGNHHFTVCSVCEEELSEKEEHAYGEYITLEDGYTYHECECGHAVSKDGPKTPAFPVGGDETIIDKGDDSESLGMGSIPMDKIKLIIIIMLVFIILLVGSIIAITIILIVTREKPAPVTASSHDAKASIEAKKETVKTK